MKFFEDFFKGLKKILGAVELSGLKFIQFKAELIATRALFHSHSIQKSSNYDDLG